MRITLEYTLARNLIKSLNFEIEFEMILKNISLKISRRYLLLLRF